MLHITDKENGIAASDQCRNPNQEHYAMRCVAVNLMAILSALSATFATMGNADLAADMELAYLEAKTLKDYLSDGL